MPNSHVPGSAITGAVIAAVLLPAPGTATPDPGADAPPTHPVITEVLFAVPTRNGDANRDGRRHSTGDEFVEVHNPHDIPLELGGYSLTSRLAAGDPEPARGFHFTFPKFTLGPGEFAVVFNGYDWRPANPQATGSATRAPASPHPDFADAWVFSADSPSPNRAMSNAADFILLADPHGNPIEVIVWGSPDPPPPDDTPRVERVTANPKSSVHLIEPDGPFDPHLRIDDHPFSPGQNPIVDLPSN